MNFQGLFTFVILLLLYEIGRSTASVPNGHVCISQGGRFPKFLLEGKPPRASVKGHDDLTLCRIYRKKTCCTSVETHPALFALRKLASNGEGSEECLMYWEAMECSLCDPEVGVREGPPALCESFCDLSFAACRNAFFSFDSMSQALTPCSPKDVICAQAATWALNGSQFCALAGFSVPSLRDMIEPACFDGKPSLATDIPADKKSFRKKKNGKQRLIKKFIRSLFRMDISDIVVWAVGGLVLTAGVLLMRRRSLSSRDRKAALIRLVQEARSKQQAKPEKRTGKRA